MNSQMMLRAVAFVAATLTAVGSAGATNLLGSTTTANISGTTFGFGPSAMPWTAEVYAPANGCLRIAVTGQATDLEAVVIAPNGTVYRDDDGGPGLFPLVKVNPTPNNGWYTVQLHNFAGTAVSANFQATLQRLAVNSASCLPSTVAQFTAAAAPESAKVNGPAARPAAGQAGF